MLPKTSPDLATSPDISAHRPTAPGRDWHHQLVTDRAHHELASTASRRITSPDDFLTAVRWALGRGLHPRANATTLRIAEALADKANRHGHLAYGRNTLATQLGLSIHCIAAHTRALRELGLLVWVEHGSKANILRARHPDQQPTTYRGTGTIFAIVVPPAYDRAHGRHIRGTGYHAQLVGVTDRGRRHETRLARAAVRRRTTRPTAGRTTPPSRSGSGLEQTLKAGGRNNYTRARAHDTIKPGTRHPNPVTPDQARTFINIAETVQQAVTWLGNTCSRRLAYLLRGRLLTEAPTTDQLIAELRTAAGTIVRRPLAYLADYLRRFPTRRVTEADRADCPDRWIQVPVLAARPSPIPLRPLISPRFLGQPERPSDSLQQLPHLASAWEEWQVAMAITRTLDYWREQDAARGHHWEHSPDPDPFKLEDDREREWIPVYA